MDGHSRRGRVRFRTWPVAALGLGCLLILVVVSMLTSARKAQEIYGQLNDLNIHHLDVDMKLRRLRSDVNLSGIFVRDYLLDVARERAPEYRERLAEFRRNNVAALADLRESASPHLERIRKLEVQLDGYWHAFEPLFDWTASEKVMRSAGFLQREVVPRREAILAIAQEIEELNNANLAAQRLEVTRRQDGFRQELYKLLWQTLLLGLSVAAVAVWRLRALERRSDHQRRVAEEAERQMRLLSQQLVATQEEERRNLSRELHDHVGQVLTALRMELGRIDRQRSPHDRQIATAVVECKGLVDRMFSTVRDLALGLRPSMLDDFGLQAALEWHVRDVISRSRVKVDLEMDGDLDQLPDRYRICLYRAVQEALTNCLRHAQAAAIHTSVRHRGDSLEADVVDNGVGFDGVSLGPGLGLRGIGERVRELHGEMTIGPAGDSGTRLSIRLPWPTPVPHEVSLAGLAR